MQKHNGLTLTELLVVLAIITILSVVALPTQQQFWQQHQGEAIMRSLASLIQHARSEAIRQGTAVTICPSADQQYCAGPWQQGVIAFLDPRTQRQPADQNVIFRVQQWRHDNGTLRWRAFGNRQSLHIDAMGQLRFQSGNFTWCPPDNDARQARQLIINANGRMRHAIDENGDGYRQDSQGRALQCP